MFHFNVFGFKRQLVCKFGLVGKLFLPLILFIYL